MRARSLRRRLAAVLLGLVLGLAAAELTARVVSPSAGEQLLFSSPDVTPRGMYRFSRELLTEPVPGFTGEVESLDYTVPIQFNSLGTRGPEPGPGRKWLALGDSFALAAQVPEERTFEALLGRAMDVEVLNAGVDGHCTWQALTLYRRLDDAVGSDTTIVVFFVGNDLADNQRVPHALRTAQPPPDGVGPPRVWQNPIPKFVLSHSYAFAYGRVAWARRSLATSAEGRRFREELVPFTRAGQGMLRQLVNASREPLRQLRDEARARGDRLVVAVAPASFGADADIAKTTFALFGLTDLDVDGPRKAVMELVRSLEIPACDLASDLADSARRGEPPYFRFDGHWNATGHRVVAKSLEGCLR